MFWKHPRFFVFNYPTNVEWHHQMAQGDQIFGQSSSCRWDRNTGWLLLSMKLIGKGNCEKCIEPLYHIGLQNDGVLYPERFRTLESLEVEPIYVPAFWIDHHACRIAVRRAYSAMLANERSLALSSGDNNAISVDSLTFLRSGSNMVRKNPACSMAYFLTR